MNQKINDRLVDIVHEALMHRGFADGESSQIIDRLIRFGEVAEYQVKKEEPSYCSFMPFGKHIGKRIDQIENGYLLWMIKQQGFFDKFKDLRQEMVVILKKRGFENII